MTCTATAESACDGVVVVATQVARFPDRQTVLLLQVRKEASVRTVKELRDEPWDLQQGQALVYGKGT